MKGETANEQQKRKREGTGQIKAKKAKGGRHTGRTANERKMRQNRKKRKGEGTGRITAKCKRERSGTAMRQNSKKRKGEEQYGQQENAKGKGEEQ